MAESNSFDEQTKLALNEVALLVGVGQEMYDMASTFKNSQELDLEAARPHAGAIIHFTKRAAKLLLDAMVHRENKRGNGLLEARKICVKDLKRAIKHAQTLSSSAQVLTQTAP